MTRLMEQLNTMFSVTVNLQAEDTIRSLRASADWENSLPLRGWSQAFLHCAWSPSSRHVES